MLRFTYKLRLSIKRRHIHCTNKIFISYIQVSFVNYSCNEISTISIGYTSVNKLWTVKPHEVIFQSSNMKKHNLWFSFMFNASLSLWFLKIHFRLSILHIFQFLIALLFSWNAMFMLWIVSVEDFNHAYCCTKCFLMAATRITVYKGSLNLNSV